MHIKKKLKIFHSPQQLLDTKQINYKLKFSLVPVAARMELLVLKLHEMTCKKIVTGKTLQDFCAIDIKKHFNLVLFPPASLFTFMLLMAQQGL